MELESRSYETFDDLRKYCHRVASVVGQACIHIWGFEDPRAIELAEHCGVAFQLTNILRDLREDALAGRVYLPAEDFERFGYSREDLRRGIADERFHRLMRFETERAEQYYRSAAALSNYLRPDGRRIYCAMFRTYHQLLEKIRRREGAVLEAPVRLAAWEKLRTAAAALFPPARGRCLLVRSGATVS
jgi:phytoene synthase